jgi:hypothetical protein
MLTYKSKVNSGSLFTHAYQSKCMMHETTHTNILHNQILLNEILSESICLGTKIIKHFNSKKHKLNAEWMKLHNEKLQKLYSSPSVVKLAKSMHL